MAAQDEPRMVRQSLLNLPIAGNVDTTSMPGYYVIKGLNPIPASDYVGMDIFLAVTEVRQLVTVTIPTIVASTSTVPSVYSLLGNAQGQREAINKLPKKFKATAPLVLEAGTVDGNAAALTDRQNIAVTLAFRINQAGLYVNAGASETVVHAVTTNPAGGFAVGTIVTGATSGAMAYVAVSGATTGTWYTFYGRFIPTEVINGSDGNTSASFTSHVFGGTLKILDQTGYFPAMGNRQGKTSWKALLNIPTANVVITTAGVYGRGQGTRMLDNVPVFGIHDGNIQRGIIGFPTNEAPVAGRTYTYDVLKYRTPASDSALSPVGSLAVLSQGIYMDDAAAGYAATQAALVALTIY